MGVDDDRKDWPFRHFQRQSGKGEEPVSSGWKGAYRLLPVFIRAPWRHPDLP